MTGAKQTLKGLCVHEQLHNNPALCPVVLTEKVNTSSFIALFASNQCSELCLSQTVESGVQGAEKAVEGVSGALAAKNDAPLVSSDKKL